MKTIIWFNFLLVLNICGFSQQDKDPFALYLEKDIDWYPSIFEIFIEQNAYVNVNKALIDKQDITTIENVLRDFKHIETTDFTVALSASQSGKKVFFFIGNFVWGKLEQGSIYSGSWQQQMPLCSGFYVHKKKCFQNEGINYHCGTKDKATPTNFIIIEK
jgi:hypothetical protein